jgi:hypothetical protein
VRSSQLVTAEPYGTVTAQLRSGERGSWFISLSRKPTILNEVYLSFLQYFKVGHGRFLAHPFNSLFTEYPTIRHCVVWATDSSLYNEPIN